jgi:hypothetical protein
LSRNESRSRAAEADDRLRLTIREAHEQEQSMRQVRDECRRLLAEMRSVAADELTREQIRAALDTHVNHLIDDAVTKAIEALPDEIRVMIQRYVDRAGNRLVDRALDGLRDDIRESIALVRVEERERARNEQRNRGVLGE